MVWLAAATDTLLLQLIVIMNTCNNMADDSCLLNRKEKGPRTLVDTSIVQDSNCIQSCFETTLNGHTQYSSDVYGQRREENTSFGQDFNEFQSYVVTTFNNGNKNA